MDGLGGGMDTMLGDLKYAVRGLLNNPSVSIIAVAALALGIGFTTVMFSIVYGALYRGLPFEGAEAIMHLERALQIAPDNATLHKSIGQVLLVHGQREKAIAHLRRALEIDPTMVDARQFLDAALRDRSGVQ